MTWGLTDDLGQSYMTSGKHGEMPEPFPLPSEAIIAKDDAGWAYCVSVTDVTKDGKEEELNGNVDKKVDPLVESTSAKKKKKKDKAPREVQPNNRDVPNRQHEATTTEQVEEDTSAIDVTERLKKVASMKKKKSSKGMDNGAKAAAIEAAGRSAILSVAIEAACRSARLAAA